MATEVLIPQDLFAAGHRFRQPFRRRKFLAVHVDAKAVARDNDTRISPRYGSDSDRRTSPRFHKRSVVSKKNVSLPSRKKDDGGLVNGKVVLLKRGEKLDEIASMVRRASPNPSPLKDDSVQVNPNPSPLKVNSENVKKLDVNVHDSRPDSPEMLPSLRQLSTSAPSATMFAGSVIMSPSPRSLPLPSFFKSKQQSCEDLVATTMDLRRMLRLE